MIITIVGPTGVGKTKLSIELAKKYNAEIINADAVQVFKDLNIGTAKITESEKEGIPHHLLDFLDPNEFYSVSDYQKDGRKIIDELLKKNKNIIIVGGTGLYIKALLFDYEFTLENKKLSFDNLSNTELKKEVDKILPSNNIHMNNRKRLLRFLESYYSSGKIIKNKNKDKEIYKSIIIGLTTDRETLYERINKRVDEMFDSGLMEEAKDLYNKKVDRCRNVIGYKEIFSYLDKKIEKDEMIELIKKNSRHYAKRQYTWFNNQMNVNWINVNFDNFDEVKEKAINIIKTSD